MFMLLYGNGIINQRLELNRKVKVRSPQLHIAANR